MWHILDWETMRRNSLISWTGPPVPSVTSVRQTVIPFFALISALNYVRTSPSFKKNVKLKIFLWSPLMKKKTWSTFSLSPDIWRASCGDKACVQIKILFLTSRWSVPWPKSIMDQILMSLYVRDDYPHKIKWSFGNLINWDAPPWIWKIILKFV